MEGLEDDADIAAAEARQRILAERAERLARHHDRAGVGALEPGHDHQQRRFAGARRADQADRLARSYMQVDVFEDMNARRAPPERQIDPGERDRRAVRGCSPEDVVHAVVPSLVRALVRVAGLVRLAHMGVWRRLVQALVACRCICAHSLAGCRGRGVAAERAGEDRGARRFADRGLRPAGAATPSRPSSKGRCKAKGLAVEIVNAGVSGDTASGGLARLDWSVPAGTDAVIVELGANDMLRGIDPKVTRRALDEIVRRLTERRHRGAARRHAGRAQSRRRLCARLRGDLSGARGEVRCCCSIRSSSTASPATPSSTSATACIRPRPASTRSSRASCPRSRNWCVHGARVAAELIQPRRI